MTQDTTDTDQRSFYKRLSDAGAEVAYLEKGGFNKHFKYAFLQEAEVKRAVSAALRKHGLTLGKVAYEPIGEITGQVAVLCCGVTITDGQQSAYFSGIGAGTDSSDKAPMKACAAALKYALTSGFLIATGDDPEDDGGTKDDKPAKKTARAEAPSSVQSPPSEEPPGAVIGTKDRAARAMAAIAAATDTKALNKLRLPVASLKQEISEDLYEPVRLAFIARTEALKTEPKE